MGGFFWGAVTALVADYIFQPRRSFWGLIIAILLLAVGILVVNFVMEEK